MSTRLQVIVGDDEAASMKEPAAREGLQTSGRVTDRLTAIRVAAEFSCPTADIEVLVDEVEGGHAE